jgi:hypothetical protein
MKLFDDKRLVREKAQLRQRGIIDLLKPLQDCHIDSKAYESMIREKKMQSFLSA